MKKWLIKKQSTESKLKLSESYRKLMRFKSHFINYPKADGLFKPVSRELIDNYNRQRQLGPRRLFCYVPYSNIFFNTHGYALSCCFNTKAVLGRYPETSVKEMWQGAERKKLCDHISHNDLSYGCDFCQYQLDTGKFTNLKATINDIYATRRFNKFPRILEFELSNQCNLECIMCSGRVSSSIRKNREFRDPLDIPYDKAFVDQLDDFILHAAEANFFGGEPFLINIYYDIWDRIMKLNPGLKVFVLTNGTILNDKIRHYIEKGNFGIGISIDAFSKELYEKIRKNASYDAVMNNIRQFHEYNKKGNRGMSLSITPMQINWKEIPDLVRFANSLQSTMYFSFLEYPKKLALWNMKSSELTEISEFYKSVDIKANTAIEQFNKQCFSDLIRQIDHWIQDPLYNNPVRDHEKHSGSAHSKAHRYSTVEEAREAFFKKIKDFTETITEYSAEEKENYYNRIREKFHGTFSVISDAESQLLIYEELNSIGVTKIMLEEILSGTEETLQKRAVDFLMSISE